MSQTFRRGVDFQVSKIDFDRAYEAVEKNMREGLERRTKLSRSSFDSQFLGINPDEGYHSSKGIAHGTSEPREEHELSRAERKWKRSSTFESELSPPEDQRKRRSFIRRRISSTPKSNSLNEVNRIIDDIARRSTRFVDENTAWSVVQLASSTRRRSWTDSHSLDEISALDVCSDGEMTSNQRYMNAVSWMRQRRKGSEAEATKCTGAAGGRLVTDVDRDTETMNATGHFSPERSIVDLRKVHPSIRNKWYDRSSTAKDEQMMNLNARLAAQDMLMKKVLKKLETMGTSSSGEQYEQTSDGGVPAPDHNKSNGGIYA